MANFYVDPQEQTASYLRRRAYGIEDPSVEYPGPSVFDQQVAELQSIPAGSLGRNDSEFTKGARQGWTGIQRDTLGGLRQVAAGLGLDSAAGWLEEQQKPFERELQTYAAPRVQRIEDVLHRAALSMLFLAKQQRGLLQLSLRATLR